MRIDAVFVLVKHSLTNRRKTTQSTGDILVSVNGQSVLNWTHQAIIKHIQQHLIVRMVVLFDNCTHKVTFSHRFCSLESHAGRTMWSSSTSEATPSRETMSTKRARGARSAIATKSTWKTRTPYEKCRQQCSNKWFELQRRNLKHFCTKKMQRTKTATVYRVRAPNMYKARGDISACNAFRNKLSHDTKL